jgi:pimeloyl-ACP methyl ester carboxylesterase
MATFVLVHGAWHGGWCWARVRDRLTAAGHRVLTPTLTGLGERKHLMSREINLETHIADVVNLLEAEELGDVVLVGHSYAGAVTPGVVDRAPERMRQLILLDALMLEFGEAAIDLTPPDVAATRRAQVEREGQGYMMPAPSAAVFGVSAPEDIAWVARRLTPHPFATYTQKLERRGAGLGNLPRAYIDCIAPPLVTITGSRARVRTKKEWQVRELATGHDAMVTAPRELAEMLASLATQS